MKHSFLNGHGAVPILILVGTALLWQSPAAADVVIGFEASKNPVTIGEEFMITLVADVPEELVGFGLDLDFPAGLLRFDEFILNSAYIPFASPDGDNIGGLAFPDYIVGDDVTLGTAKFTALAAGNATITGGITSGDLTEGFAELSGGFSQPVFNSLNLVISAGDNDDDGDDDDNPIPEPGTLVLLALAGLWFVNRGRS